MFDNLALALANTKLSHQVAKTYIGDECIHGWIMEYSFLTGNCTILLANNRDRKTIKINDITKIAQHNENLITTTIYEKPQ